MRTQIKVGGITILPNQTKQIDLFVARLPTGTQASIPVVVINGKNDGNKLWITSAIHGDELNGVEVIRQVLEKINPAKLSGTVFLVPIVNVFGFLQESRYLPDRRDLNRCFPGSPRSHLAGRIANILMKEIVTQCQYGIDLHTGSNHRINLPQIRANLDNRITKKMALAFGAPIAMHARLRDGSLREAATSSGVHTLLYEAGEANRFNANAIQHGVTGILRILSLLEMQKLTAVKNKPIFLSRSSAWVRSKRSGIFHSTVKLGEKIAKGKRLGFVTDTLGTKKSNIFSPIKGIVISYTLDPIVHRGDALVHIAEGKMLAGK